MFKLTNPSHVDAARVKREAVDLPDRSMFLLQMSFLWMLDVFLRSRAAALPHHTASPPEWGVVLLGPGHDGQITFLRWPVEEWVSGPKCRPWPDASELYLQGEDANRNRDVQKLKETGKTKKQGTKELEHKKCGRMEELRIKTKDEHG